MINRRSVVRSLVLAPIVLLASRFAMAKIKPLPTTPAAGAAPANALGAQEPLAKAMQYVEDASKASAARTDKTANCANCSKFNKCSPADTSCKPAAKDAAYAPCEIFAGKSVAKAGWCLSWAKG